MPAILPTGTTSTSGGDYSVIATAGTVSIVPTANTPNANVTAPSASGSLVTVGLVLGLLLGVYYVWKGHL
jgi:ABC-type transport system involved in cytochrome c biogenesis permease subunit